MTPEFYILAFHVVCSVLCVGLSFFNPYFKGRMSQPRPADVMITVLLSVLPLFNLVLLYGHFLIMRDHFKTKTRFDYR